MDYIDTVLQDTPFITGIPTYKYTNVQNAELYGFEAEGQVSLTEHLGLFGMISQCCRKRSGQRCSPQQHPTIKWHFGSPLGKSFC